MDIKQSFLLGVANSLVAIFVWGFILTTEMDGSYKGIAYGFSLFIFLISAAADIKRR